ncbi:MAG: hypothetical protein A3I39_01460 [Candidatus Yanofskybacteria bacterium RIFCSPLOWO2_02_FULL_47_9b]|uniref:N-formylglutamate amidohydrolase n=1 Tax=Candidatus Yanofskybacteria bacterium RIFCSPLOWO2_02_FULL_47_9b TaxID=1802708 RepID=A0A1F8H9R3_9BACT|nr:MAG: hypothetical protein A3I39_01460 [Candidatus Yanofskybacteria bacterium RIFCSPLOWO2_02_FULL_47_9b]
MYFEVSNNENSSIICNVPHAGTAIPEEFRKSFVLTQEELDTEAEYMADKHTDVLYSELLYVSSFIMSKISRIVVDIERFQNEEDEPMAKVGMSAFYTRTSSGMALRNISQEMKNILERIYNDYHDSFADTVDLVLKKNNLALIVDCHSFPSVPRIYESDQKSERPDICIGTDEYHTPQKMTYLLKKNLEDVGYSVKINTPFSGSIVPTRYYQKDRRVLSIMVEVNRTLYMNEENFKKLKNISEVGRTVSRCIIKSLNQFLE